VLSAGYAYCGVIDTGQLHTNGLSALSKTVSPDFKFPHRLPSDLMLQLHGGNDRPLVVNVSAAR